MSSLSSSRDILRGTGPVPQPISLLRRAPPSLELATYETFRKQFTGRGATYRLARFHCAHFEWNHCDAKSSVHAGASGHFSAPNAFVTEAKEANRRRKQPIRLKLHYISIPANPEEDAALARNLTGDSEAGEKNSRLHYAQVGQKGLRSWRQLRCDIANSLRMALTDA